MINIKRVALEIKTIGLYDGILQDMLKASGVSSMNEKEIEHCLIDNPSFVDEYKAVNIQYNISNIHIKNIPLTPLLQEHELQRVVLLNKYLEFLRENEKYTIEFEQSTTLITVMSIEFFVLFSAQYFIVLMDMKNWQFEIYGLFLTSIVLAYMYSKKQKALYASKKIEFDIRYEKALVLLSELEDEEVIKKEDLWVLEDDVHI
ncbi:MAG: hypothetical protein PHE67_11285 [Campylobacterales bacterium]|nr:hypothetical protein [Campylobacterales bacterium]